MKIRTYTDQDREVPDGFTCDGCGALRNETIGNGKICAAFRRGLLTAKDGKGIKAFECVLACRNCLILDTLEDADAATDV